MTMELLYMYLLIHTNLVLLFLALSYRISSPSYAWFSSSWSPWWSYRRSRTNGPSTSHSSSWTTQPPPWDYTRTWESSNKTLTGVLHLWNAFWRTSVMPTFCMLCFEISLFMSQLHHKEQLHVYIHTHTHSLVCQTYLLVCWGTSWKMLE